MNKIEQIDELLTQHLQTEGVRPEDREVMVALQQLAKEYLEDNKIMDTEGTERAKPGTVYEAKLASMTIAEMANLGVKLISVNGDSLFWVTSFGQMYKFQERDKAFEAECLWLMSNVK
jgi:hypothetical protein